MKFYIRQYKDDFFSASTKIVKNSDGSFQLTWTKGQVPINQLEAQANVIYPTEPDISDVITVSKILTEKKTDKPLNNPHQIIACSVARDSKSFSFVDVLKYTNYTKGSTGFFKNASQIDPMMYILVPFPDTPIDEWIFVIVSKTLEVDGINVTDSFDIDINRTLSDIGNQYLPGIILSKEDNLISAQLKNPDGSLIVKQDVDIYFETTCGYLTKSRSKTNNKGIATTELIGGLEGKVKAGFKYFSGKTELII